MRRMTTPGLLAIAWVALSCSAGCASSSKKSAKASPDNPVAGTGPANGAGSGGSAANSPAATTPANTNQTPATNSTPSNAVNLVGTTPVLIVLGGYTSCADTSGKGDPRNQMMTSLFNAVNTTVTKAAGAAPAYILGCYTIDYNNVVFSLSTDAATKGPTTANVDALIPAVQTLIAGVKNPALYIIGHSYGGWTAMHTVLGLQGKATIGGLMTLDPISKVNCTPTSFIAASFGGGSSPVDCLRAPTDFGDSSLITLAKDVGFWWNFYETGGAILHSGPLTDAGKNIVKPYTGSGFDPHNAFGGDTALFTQLGGLITAAMAGKPLPAN